MSSSRASPPRGCGRLRRSTAFAAGNGLARLSIDQGLGAETLYEPQPATITLSGVPVHFPVGGFLQATADGEAALVEAVREASRVQKRSRTCSPASAHSRWRCVRPMRRRLRAMPRRRSSSAQELRSSIATSIAGRSIPASWALRGGRSRSAARRSRRAGGGARRLNGAADRLRQLQPRDLRA